MEDWCVSAKKMGKSASKPKNRDKFIKNRDSNLNWSTRFGSLPLRFKSRIHKSSQSPKHKDIKEWLKSLDLEQYTGLFEKYGGVEDLLEFSEADLKDLGVKISSHRATIISNLTILRAKYHGNFRRQPSIRHSVAVEKSVISEDDKMSQLSTVYETVQSKSLDNLIMEPVADPTMNAQDLRKALEWELSLENKDLRSHAWYHGAIPRARAEDIVRLDGAFLVRDCTSQPGNYVLTCRTKTLPLHFVINKIILQPDTVYEHLQYQFEGDAFDTVPDLITYYVGSGKPITQASNARIQNPVNRLYPLSFYASKYPPPLASRRGRIAAKQRSHSLTPAEVTRMAEKCNSADGVIQSPLMTRSAGCDPTNRFNTHSLPRSPHVKMSLSTNTLGRGFKPTNGNDAYWKQTDISAESPPPKPSRVPNAYHASGSDSGNGSGDSAGDSLDPKVAGVIIKNPRYIPASESSTTLKNFQTDWGEVETRLLEMQQELHAESIFDIENFQTILLPVGESKPLDAKALRGVKMILKDSGARVLANHITRTDLDVVFHRRPDLMANGVELCVLPHGQQLRLDLIERTECLKLFVAITILTCADEVERTETLNKWIEVAIDTKTALGNLFGFCGIMLGLCLPQVERLDTMWHMLRQKHTDSAFNFEAKLRPTLKNMNNCSNPQAPNTTIPHLLPLVLLLERTLDDFIATPTLEHNQYANVLGLWESNTQDFGLTTMLNHLETARKYIQSSAAYKRNSEIVLGDARLDELTGDMFRTEFHMKFLWGSRGAQVPHAERHSKFEQVLNAIADKYCPLRDDAEV